MEIFMGKNPDDPPWKNHHRHLGNLAISLGHFYQGLAADQGLLELMPSLVGYLEVQDT